MEKESVDENKYLLKALIAPIYGKCSIFVLLQHGKCKLTTMQTGYQKGESIGLLTKKIKIKIKMKNSEFRKTKNFNMVGEIKMLQ